MGALMMYAFVIIVALVSGIYYWRKDHMTDTTNKNCQSQ